MSFTKFNPRSTVLIIFILALGALRVLFNADKNLSFLANFTPLGAAALFGGVYFSEKIKAFAFPLLALSLSDVILSLAVYKTFGHGLLYEGWYWTYGAFALMTLVGRIFIKHVGISTIVGAALICTFIHWVVTDFGVWYEGTMYAKTISGFISCLIAAIPFELSFLSGTLLYSAILFGAFQWMQQRYPALNTAV
ncbi:MAG: hypothetical protein NVS1B13_11570 [Flavisolibacter sp.]